MNNQKLFRFLVVASAFLFTIQLFAADKPASFQAGYAKQNITPQAPVPMWGYGGRHDMLSEGTLKPLFAKAIVIQAGDDKVALVGLDMGRGPTRPMTEKIRQAIAAQAGIEHLMISGSHTHHGPVIELLDRDGFGKGRFDAAVAYSQKLPDLIIAVILAADKNMQPARIGVGTKQVSFNRNRHSKRIPKAVDTNLSIIRFDPLDDQPSAKPIAVLVNYAAHPTMTDSDGLKFSPDYPGFMEDKVEADLQTGCVFMQGASGDIRQPNGAATECVEDALLLMIEASIALLYVRRGWGCFCGHLSANGSLP